MTSITIFDRDYAMPKGFVRGTHRTRNPRETFDEYKRFMPLMGITRLANLTGLDKIGMPVYEAIRPNSRGVNTSQGKGFDADAAKVSALMESIESWHAEHITHPLRWESYLTLRSVAPVVDVTQLPLSPAGELFLDRPMRWIEGYDLMQQQPTWIPYECASINFVFPPNLPRTFYQNSNGLASGNHVLEAIVHGLCEVIERDAEVLWRIGDDFRQVDLAKVDDPCCRQAVDLIRRAGLHVAALDITSGAGIPVYHCIIMERPDRPSVHGFGINIGFGCHLAPEIALLRALNEAVQARTTYIAGNRDDLFRDEYATLTDEVLLRDVWNEIFNAPARETLATWPSRATDSFEEDIAVLLSALSQVGMESTVVVDLTKPEIGIPIVKVVVPGMEGPHRDGYRAGRRAAQFMNQQGE